MATYTIPLRTFVDTRIAGIVSNYFLVPSGSGSFGIRTIEIPKSGVITPPSSTDPIVVRQVDPITHVYNPALHKLFAMIVTGTPTGSQFLANSDTYVSGTLGFIFSTNVGLTLEIVYQGIGSKLFASDLNEITAGTLLQDGCVLSRHLNVSSLVLSGTLTVAGALKISGTSLLSLGKLTSDPAPSSANVGGIYYHVSEKQFKGIAETSTPGTYKLVLLG